MGHGRVAWLETLYITVGVSQGGWKETEGKFDKEKEYSREEQASELLVPCERRKSELSSTRSALLEENRDYNGAFGFPADHI